MLYILQFQGVTKKTFIPKKLENIVKLFKSKLNWIVYLHELEFHSKIMNGFELKENGIIY